MNEELILLYKSKALLYTGDMQKAKEELDPLSPEEDKSLRPRSLDDFTGQENVKEKLRVSVQAAKSREEPLDHILLSGPPGLGKTTLAGILASEMRSRLHSTSAPILSRPKEIARLLTLLEDGDIFFIDEIHRLPRACEEILYSAMEDGCIDFIIGEGMGAQSVKLNLKPFTLVGATTRSGMLSSPLKTRFGMELKLEFYSPSELCVVIERSSNLLDIRIEHQAAQEIAKRARMTPRIANRIVRRLRDYATVGDKSWIDSDFAIECLEKLGIDDLGLIQLDRQILHFLTERYFGRAVGLNTLAALVDEEPQTLEEDHEPFMMRIGLLEKTPQGRIATELAYQILKLDSPSAKKTASQNQLLGLQEHR